MIDTKVEIKASARNLSEDDLKKVAINLGKNNQSIINQECLSLLQQKLSEEEYNEFYNNLKD